MVIITKLLYKYIQIAIGCRSNIGKFNQMLKTFKMKQLYRTFQFFKV